MTTARRSYDRPGSGSPDWATILGSVSAALAVPPLAASGRLARAIGVEDTVRNRIVLGVVGTRELATASGLLAFPRRWMLWGRVAGDAMDLALLGGALASALGDEGRRRHRLPRTAAAAGMVAAVTAADVYAALKGEKADSPVEVVGSVTVNKPAPECYRYWRRLENLPRFMLHLDEVTEDGAGTSHWRATAPFGRTVEWDARTTEDVPGQKMAWESIADADVANSGCVTFRVAPGGGTEVRAEITYRGLGPVGRAVARYFGEEPHQQLDDDLRRFKQVMETGEVMRSDGALLGKQARSEFPQRPAQPAPREELAELGVVPVSPAAAPPAASGSADGTQNGTRPSHAAGARS